MRSRREQIRAYRFVTRRIVTALLGGDPDSADPPMRRAGLTTFASAMIAALVLAGFGVYGLVRPGGDTSWRQGGSLIVEKDTGARFVYSDGRLHPVLNYASARLYLGAAGANVVGVSADSLAGVPRGRPIGIPNAPDALPAPDDLTGLPWSVCTAGDPDGASDEPVVTVGIGRDFPHAAGLGDRGLLVEAGGDGTYLLWQGKRLRIRDSSAMISLGWSNSSVLPVAPAFLNAVPAGPDLAAPAIDGAGRPGPRVGDAAGTVGTPYEVTTPRGSQYFVLLSDGLAPTYEVTAELLLGRTGAGDFEKLTPLEYEHAPKSARDLKLSDVPDHLPALAGLSEASDPAVCSSFRGGRLTTIETYRSAPRELTAHPTPAAGRTDELGGLRAGAVLVPGGGGALVRATASPGVPTGATYLVTDQGIRYGVPTPDALAALGYAKTEPVLVPGGLLDLVPAGPVLDPAAAKLFVDTGASPSPSPHPTPTT